MVLEELKEEIHRLLVKRIYDCFALEYTEFNITKNHKEGYGDFTSTVAFSLSKVLKRPPMEIAGQLMVEVATTESLHLRVEAVAPGFLNIYLLQDWKLMVMKKMQSTPLDAGHLLQILRDYREENTSLIKEIEYIAFRTEWVLAVLKGEGLQLYTDFHEGQYIPLPLEEKLINLVMDWAEIQGEEKIDEKRLLQILQEIFEVFWKYHNSIVIRQLEEPQKSFVLGLFIVLNKIMGISYF